MDMRVSDRLMQMEMFVCPFTHLLVVLMSMMFIMRVGMGMLLRFVPMNLPMSFSIEEKHPREHNQCSNPEYVRRMLSQEQNGKTR